MSSLPVETEEDENWANSLSQMNGRSTELKFVVRCYGVRSFSRGL